MRLLLGTELNYIHMLTVICWNTLCKTLNNSVLHKKNTLRSFTKPVELHLLCWFWKEIHLHLHYFSFFFYELKWVEALYLHSCTAWSPNHVRNIDFTFSKLVAGEVVTISLLSCCSFTHPFYHCFQDFISCSFAFNYFFPSWTLELTGNETVDERIFTGTEMKEVSHK